MWLSVKLKTDAAQAESLSDALMAQGALSVGIEDADAGTPAEQPQFGEPGLPSAPLWSHSVVIALFAADTELITALTAAAQRAGLEAVPDFVIETIEEQNWVQLTQAQFEPIRITDTLWIVPSWHDAPDPTALNIAMDPGMAFGTGSHPTTRLCLEWLCDAVRPGLRVLDYGCGSGILAITAARLGAASVTGIDIDPDAVEAARTNAAHNGVAGRWQSSDQTLSEQYEVVVANILTNPLCVLAPGIAAHVASGGRLALSGVLDSQAEQVIAAYAPWLSLRVGAVLEGWVRLEGQRC